MHDFMDLYFFIMLYNINKYVIFYIYKHYYLIII